MFSPLGWEIWVFRGVRGWKFHFRPSRDLHIKEDGMLVLVGRWVSTFQTSLSRVFLRIAGFVAERLWFFVGDSAPLKRGEGQLSVLNDLSHTMFLSD